MASPINAASAYANVARLMNDVGSSSLGNPLGAASSNGPSFSSVLKEAVGAVSEMGAKSDLQTRMAAAGKANMIDVVTAVSETEVAVDAVVAVRDKVIAAYEDILRMPI
jgi:flagellar hook-basal body complex protein FliE